VLDLSHTNVTEATMQALVVLRADALRELRLNGCSMTTQSVFPLGAIPLQTIELGGCREVRVCARAPRPTHPAPRSSTTARRRRSSR